MTQTPAPRFVTRPDAPSVSDPRYDRWAAEAALTFPGGTLSSAYGNLIQTVALGSLTSVCTPPTKDVSVKSHARINTIGGNPTTVAAHTYVKSQYPKKNSSAGAAGEPVRVVTSVGEYQARLTGSMQDLAAYLCANGAAIYDAFWVYSPSGAQYGPFTPSSN